MQTILWGVVVGLLVGVFSGLIGVGGGILLLPLLLYGFKLEQHTAQGTSLAVLLPPTGLLAFMKYYRQGHADLRLGLIIAVGVLLGGYFGATWAQQIPAATLRKCVAALLVVVAAKMFLQK